MAPQSADTIQVLLVDDEQDLRTLVRHRLERAGQFSVIGEASSTTEAIRLAEDEQPDVILLDELLGTERGSDAIGQLMRVAPHTMVATLTVLDAEDEEEAMRAAGAFAYYEKTMLSELAQHLREDLDTFRRAIAGEDVVAPAATSRRS